MQEKNVVKLEMRYSTLYLNFGPFYGCLQPLTFHNFFFDK